MRHVTSCSLASLLTLTPSAAEAASLVYSPEPARGLAAPLDEATVDARIYAFVPTEAGVSQVRFLLDGVPLTLDQVAPFDLAGTDPTGLARPLDTRGLTAGIHRVDAELTRPGQALERLSATFEVAPDLLGPSGQVSTYADTPWAAVHRDSRNSGYSPFVAPLDPTPAWSALTGHAMFVSVTEGPEGHLYATTTREAGFSNLYALDRDGRVLWQSPLSGDPGGMDSDAGGSAPTVDRDGDLYVSDSTALWAWRADGSLKWTSPLPGGFISTVLTSRGDVVGITGGGKVFLIDGENGAALAPYLPLPGVDGPPPPETPPGLWAGMMDPEVIDRNWAGLLGTDQEVANTPALDPRIDRVFTVGVGATPDVGSIYGIDVAGDVISIAWELGIGRPSAASPSLSPDFETLYTSDGDGVLYAVDTASGDLRWALPLGDNAGSPSVGPDGTIYTLAGGAVAAVSPDGILRWERRYDDLAARRLPPLPYEGELIQPESRVDTVVTLTDEHLYVGVLFGYALPLPGTGAAFLLVEETALVIGDLASGDPVAPLVPLADTPENILVPGSDGSLYLGYLSIYSSVTYNSLNADLPEGLQVDAPVGGIQAFRPRSYRDLAHRQVVSAAAATTRGADALAAGEIEAAYREVGRAGAQVRQAPGSIDRAVAARRLGPRAARQAKAALVTAQAGLDDAYNRLAHLRLGASAEAEASAAEVIDGARLALDAAMTALAPPGGAVAP